MTLQHFLAVDTFLKDETLDSGPIDKREATLFEI